MLSDGAGRMGIDGGVVKNGAMNDVKSEAMSRVGGWGPKSGDECYREATRSDELWRGRLGNGTAEPNAVGK
jgi:hypothetical protein